jgi:RNA polymerase sigma-70 factor (ECF subfamily)
VSTENNEKQIVERLNEGSKDAFHYLFGFFGTKIHAFALSYLKNEADADELLQEVLRWM